MKFTANDLARLIEGRIDGNPEVVVDKVSKIEEGTPGSVSFLANPKYKPFIYASKASVIIVDDNFSPEMAVEPTLIRVKDPYVAFARLLEIYNKIKHSKTGISAKAEIAESASIGKDVYIAPFVVIGENVVIGDNSIVYSNTAIGDNVHIGNDCLIFSNVNIYSDCIIGSQVTLHAGVVVGSDGFGFAPQKDSNYKKVAQIGNVIIEDQVEIGANTTIDRATMGSTIIRKGVKLDNLIQIAHNVEIDENTVIAALTGVSGSSKIGKNCMIGGQVGIVGHLQIADEVKIAAQAGVSSSIKEKGFTALGSPAIEYNNYKKSYIHFKNLQSLVDRINVLENEIAELNQKK
ncbi:MAG: UDP-3-O-(3-hydroxymyristoyl)glucosamine N-acyltransferase [Bacteroidales bacterium]